MQDETLALSAGRIKPCFPSCIALGTAFIPFETRQTARLRVRAF